MIEAVALKERYIPEAGPDFANTMTRLPRPGSAVPLRWSCWAAEARCRRRETLSGSPILDANTRYFLTGQGRPHFVCAVTYNA